MLKITKPNKKTDLSEKVYQAVNNEIFLLGYTNVDAYVKPCDAFHPSPVKILRIVYPTTISYQHSEFKYTLYQGNVALYSNRSLIEIVHFIHQNGLSSEKYDLTGAKRPSMWYQHRYTDDQAFKSFLIEKRKQVETNYLNQIVTLTQNLKHDMEWFDKKIDDLEKQALTLYLYEYKGKIMVMNKENFLYFPSHAATQSPNGLLPFRIKESETIKIVSAGCHLSVVKISKIESYRRNKYCRFVSKDMVSLWCHADELIKHKLL